MFVLEHLWIIPLLPLLGAAANGIFGTSGVVASFRPGATKICLDPTGIPVPIRDSSVKLLPRRLMETSAKE